MINAHSLALPRARPCDARTLSERNPLLNSNTTAQRVSPETVRFPEKKKKNNVSAGFQSWGEVARRFAGPLETQAVASLGENGDERLREGLEDPWPGTLSVKQACVSFARRASC